MAYTVGMVPEQNIWPSQDSWCNIIIATINDTPSYSILNIFSHALIGLQLKPLGDNICTSLLILYTPYNNNLLLSESFNQCVLQLNPTIILKVNSALIRQRRCTLSILYLYKQSFKVGK